MDAVRPDRLRKLRGMLWAALFVTLGWCVLSLASSPISASAAEAEAPGSGLLGIVGDTLGGTTSVLSQTVAAVDEVLESATTSVVPVAEPVIEPVPAPVRAPVAQAVVAVTATADRVEQNADAAVSGTVGVATGAVGAAAHAEVVSAVVESVTDVVASVPVVGDVVDATGLGAVTVDLAEGIDQGVATLVGSAPPTCSVLPALPTSGIEVIVGLVNPRQPHPPLGNTSPPASAAPDRGSTALATAASAVAAVPTAPTSTHVSTALATALPSVSLRAAAVSADGDVPALDGPVPPNGGATLVPASSGSASISGAGGGGGSGGAAAVNDDAQGSGTGGFAVTHSISDDAVPGAPVFDTDISPD